MAGTTGFRPNKLVLGNDVYDALVEHADIIDRIKYTQRGVATREILAELFHVDEVLVAAGRAEHRQGGSDERDLVDRELQGDAARLRARSRRSTRRPAGYTFAWTGLIPGATNATGGVIARYREEQAHSDILEIRTAFDTATVATDLGQFFARRSPDGLRRARAAALGRRVHRARQPVPDEEPGATTRACSDSARSPSWPRRTRSGGERRAPEALRRSRAATRRRHAGRAEEPDDEIEIPDGVTPGETPGWPLGLFVVPLTDEQRAELADAGISGTHTEEDLTALLGALTPAAEGETPDTPPADGDALPEGVTDLGGGWYQLADGETKVHGRAKLAEALQ
jgi:hypothetical protein